MQTCSKCFQNKEETEFSLRSGMCKKCTRQKTLKRKYGLTDKKYAEMFLHQNGCCAICGKHESNGARRLAVDHCHTSGKVRKLLCFKCNAALGLLNESEETVLSMLSYIKEHI